MHVLCSAKLKQSRWQPVWHPLKQAAQTSEKGTRLGFKFQLCYCPSGGHFTFLSFILHL